MFFVHSGDVMENRVTSVKRFALGAGGHRYRIQATEREGANNREQQEYYLAYQEY